ncbi:MAG: hypothetical protein DI539_15970 [Flavobacterium psychrophilum]|nr:MAG: hypothetical protein DI539_15970 [Flavobacterium psychrophilum]
MAADEQFLPVEYSFDISYNISVLKSFLDFGELNVEKEIESLKEAYESRKKTIPYKLRKDNPDKFNEELDMVYNSLYDDWYLMDVQIRSRFRQSVLIQLYSFMEVQLFKQCELHKWRNNKEYSVRELKGNTDLDKVALYYKNSVHFNIKELKEWQFIDSFRRLRNLLVHHEGLITNEDDYNRMRKFEISCDIELKNYIEGEHLIVLSNTAFIEKCINNVKAFLLQTLVARKNE